MRRVVGQESGEFRSTRRLHIKQLPELWLYRAYQATGFLAAPQWLDCFEIPADQMLV